MPTIRRMAKEGNAKGQRRKDAEPLPPHKQLSATLRLRDSALNSLQFTLKASIPRREIAFLTSFQEHMQVPTIKRMAKEGNAKVQRRKDAEPLPPHKQLSATLRLRDSALSSLQFTLKAALPRREIAFLIVFKNICQCQRSNEWRKKETQRCRGARTQSLGRRTNNSLRLSDFATLR